MKKITLNLLFAFICGISFAQNLNTRKLQDSLKHELIVARNDTSRMLIIADLCSSFQFNDFDSLVVYSTKGLTLARRIKFPRGEAKILCYLAFGLQLQGDMPKSLELLFKALQMAQENNYALETVRCLNYIGDAYWFLNDFPKSISFYKKASQINQTIPNLAEKASQNTDLNFNIALAYLSLNRLDSAKAFLGKPAKEILSNDFSYSYFLILDGKLRFKLGDHKAAFANLTHSIQINDKNHDNYLNSDACYFLAEFFKETAQRDSCIYYAKKGLASGQKMNYKSGILENSKLLTEQYGDKDVKQAYYYLKLATAVNDDLFGSKKVKELQKTLSEEQEKQREKEAEQVAYQNQLKEYAFLAGLTILLLIAFILYRNNRREKKGKKLLQEKNEVIEKTLANLKSTQTQLIQSEKMASLGELTAGIAHEIQNPLNFVNNFSEVNREMLNELVEELDKGDIVEAKAIAADIRQNEEKINHHGKRADAIVKGMLQHSQSGSGTKEPTNINALADEYMRLAYHGLRSKDKSFNAEMVMHFDKKLPKIKVIPQDIGRVMLNLFNNAFYAVLQKQKATGASYNPEVSVTTSTENGQVIIKVKDNGIGIPDAIKEKIMQPFFTTKPTGEGTGLGLSLTYDMVVKGHGGKIDVHTKENEFTEFIIVLPIG